MGSGLLANIDFGNLLETMAPILLLGMAVLLFKAFVNKSIKNAKRSKKRRSLSEQEKPVSSNTDPFSGKKSGRICRKCGSEMVLRNNKKTKEAFWGCSSFPRCRYTEQV